MKPIITIMKMGMTMNETTGNISWRPAPEQLGPSGVQLMVTDGINPVIQNFLVDVRNRPVVNRLPAILNTPLTNATVNQTYTHIVLARDDDGDPLAYSLEPKPSGMTIDNVTGVITWKPGPWQVGNHTVVIRVSDGKGSVTQNFTIRVVSDVVPPPPPKPKPPVKQDLTLLFGVTGVLSAILVLMVIFMITRTRHGNMMEAQLRKGRPASGRAAPTVQAAGRSQLRKPPGATGTRPAEVRANEDREREQDEDLEEDEDLDEALRRHAPPPVPPPEAAPGETESVDDDLAEEEDQNLDDTEVLQMEDAPRETSDGAGRAKPSGDGKPARQSKKEELEAVLSTLGVKKDGKGPAPQKDAKGGSTQKAGKAPDRKKEGKDMDRSIEEILGIKP